RIENILRIQQDDEQDHQDDGHGNAAGADHGQHAGPADSRTAHSPKVSVGTKERHHEKDNLDHQVDGTEDQGGYPQAQSALLIGCENGKHISGHCRRLQGDIQHHPDLEQDEAEIQHAAGAGHDRQQHHEGSEQHTAGVTNQHAGGDEFKKHAEPDFAPGIASPSFPPAAVIIIIVIIPIPAALAGAVVIIVIVVIPAAAAARTVIVVLVVVITAAALAGAVVVVFLVVIASPVGPGPHVVFILVILK